MFRVERIGFVAAVTGAAMLVVGAAGDLVAQDGAALVQQRQDLMREMGGSFGPMVAVLKGESSDFAAAAASAGVIHTNSGKIAELFPEGTGQDVISQSRAKPEVWSQRAEFEANAQKLAEESAKLVAVAQTADAQAYATQFQALGKACGGCHSGKFAEGGKFRFAKQ